MDMRKTNEKKRSPRLWYWGEPKEGMSLEDCERIAKEIPPFDPETRLVNLCIAFR